MNKLSRETLAIVEDLGNVIFIGALATYMHTKSGRDSQDIDFVVERQISDEELLSKGYKKSITGKQPWFTPRGIKIDIYCGGIPGVSYDWIVKNSKTHALGPKHSIRTLGLESLIVAKHKAGRDQDVEDLANIAKRKYHDINWNLIKQITGDQFTAEKIKQDMDFLYKS